MTQPTPHAVSGTPPNQAKPIGEVHIFVYGWERGRSEVLVKFPREAEPGRAGAAANQGKLRKLVIAELEDSFRTFESSAAGDEQ
jgi:hypothetical protein